MQENELKNYINENKTLILEYINTEILKDIGVLSSGFFQRLLDEYFSKENKRISTNGLNADTLIYYLICEILGQAKQAYPFFRADTLSLDELYKEVKVYYNYVKFTMENDIFTISLVQTKAGVNTLDEELIKFSKDFTLKTSGLEEFIQNKKTK